MQLTSITTGSSEWSGREGLGVWDLQMQTILYKMDKQQGPTVQHRELYLISYNNPYGKEHIHTSMYLYISESLSYTSKINTTL